MTVTTIDRRLTGTLRRFHSLILGTSLVLFVLLVLAGCAGGCLCSVDLPGQGPINGFLFSTEEVKCLSTTLTISKVGANLSPGTVTFTNQKTGTQYDGSGPVNGSGAISSGFPPSAPGGTYNVTVNGQAAGVVTYGAGNC